MTYMYQGSSFHYHQSKHCDSCCFYFRLFPFCCGCFLLSFSSSSSSSSPFPPPRQMTPLHLASDKGQLEILELLVKHGAKVGRDGGTSCTAQADYFHSQTHTPVLQNTSFPLLSIEKFAHVACIIPNHVHCTGTCVTLCSSVPSSAGEPP